MIRLENKPLSNVSLEYLKKQQKKVDEENSFEDKIKTAQSKWASKSSSKKGKTVFSEIVDCLSKMCVSVEICNYCEQNEANDIEHIEPKSFFPEKVFCWDNYILACKQCNSAYKLDKCSVFDENDEVIFVPRGQEPATKMHAFINPRIEDPSRLLMINTCAFNFEILPGLTQREIRKAEQTLTILQLNGRDTLIQARKNAAKYYYHRMELLSEILEGTTVEDIKRILDPYSDQIDDEMELDSLKLKIKESFKKDIQTHQHPSVWYSIKKIDSISKPKWEVIFTKIPEALNW